MRQPVEWEFAGCVFPSRHEVVAAKARAKPDSSMISIILISKLLF